MASKADRDQLNLFAPAPASSAGPCAPSDNEGGTDVHLEPNPSHSEPVSPLSGPPSSGPPPKSQELAHRILRLVVGDITEQRVDVIVNAANTSLLGGGGVDGAIHRRGGCAILEECQKIRAAQGGCKTGAAVMTGAGDLAAQYVVHTVGPRWRGGGHGEEELLRSAYRSAVALAVKYGARTIALPAISTGAYRYPIAEAACVALQVLSESIARASSEALSDGSSTEIPGMALSGDTPTASGESANEGAGAGAGLTEVRMVVMDGPVRAAFVAAWPEILGAPAEFEDL